MGLVVVDTRPTQISENVLASCNPDHPLFAVAKHIHEALLGLREYLDELVLKELLRSDPEFRADWKYLVDNGDYHVLLTNRGYTNRLRRSDREVMRELEAKIGQLGSMVLLKTQGDNVVEKIRNYFSVASRSDKYGLV